MRASTNAASRSTDRIRAKAICATSAAVFAIAGLLALAHAGEAPPAGQAAPKENANGCGAFAWPVSKELEWFADKNLKRAASGARLSQIDRAVELTLKPTKSFQFFLPPEQKPPPDSYSGYVTFRGVPRPGNYQVTISREAWIDVFENGARLSLVAVSDAPDCDGARKSLRYALAPGDLVLVQVSGAPERSIKVAFELLP